MLTSSDGEALFLLRLDRSLSTQQPCPESTTAGFCQELEQHDLWQESAKGQGWKD
jgi:hypothetical protein